MHTAVPAQALERRSRAAEVFNLVVVVVIDEQEIFNPSHVE